VSGQAVEYRDLSSAEHHAALTEAGLPPHLVDLLVEVDGNLAGGALVDGSGDLSRLIGHPTTPLTSSIAAALGR
jgi:NAD(P)H dehydrogenase (quinone)